MKNSISLNHYPDNYVEEELPQVIVEIRYKNSDKFNHWKALLLSNEIEKFLNEKGKITKWQISFKEINHES